MNTIKLYHQFNQPFVNNSAVVKRYYIKSVPVNNKCTSSIRNFYKVSQDLLRGGMLYKKGLLQLKNLGSDLIIDLRNPLNPIEAVLIAHEKVLAKRLELNYVNIPISYGGKNTPETIAKILSLVDKHKLSFLHCTRGKDRTGFVTALYKITEKNVLVEEAVNEMVEKGHLKKVFPKMIPNLREIALSLSKKVDCK